LLFQGKQTSRRVVELRFELRRLKGERPLVSRPQVAIALRVPVSRVLAAIEFVASIGLITPIWLIAPIRLLTWPIRLRARWGPPRLILGTLRHGR
jgi:hypothetical protein